MESHSGAAAAAVMMKKRKRRTILLPVDGEDGDENASEKRGYWN